jgi:transcriptional regulator with XRE-family HTH domain
MTQGQRFKKILKALDLTQIELAEKLGLAKQSVNKVAKDTGNFSVDIYIKLLTEYNVNLNYILAGIEPMFLTKRDKQPRPLYDDVSKLVEDMLEKKFKEKGL